MTVFWIVVAVLLLLLPLFCVRIVTQYEKAHA